MGLGLHNTNRNDTINGPAITVPPLHAKIADTRPSCRNAVLDAIDRLHRLAGATEFARRDIVASRGAPDEYEEVAGDFTHRQDLMVPHIAAR